MIEFYSPKTFDVVEIPAWICENFHRITQNYDEYISFDEHSDPEYNETYFPCKLLVPAELNPRIVDYGYCKGLPYDDIWLTEPGKPIRYDRGKNTAYIDICINGDIMCAVCKVKKLYHVYLTDETNGNEMEIDTFYSAAKIASKQIKDKYGSQCKPGYVITVKNYAYQNVMTYTDEIARLRALTGLSQAAFAAKYLIPRRTVENWESGISECPIYTRKLLQDAVEREYGTESKA